MIFTIKYTARVILCALILVSTVMTPAYANVAFMVEQHPKFVFDSKIYSIPVEAVEILDYIAKYLQSNPSEQLVISSGGGDGGSSEISLLFGANRGSLIEKELLSRGARASQIETVSVGDSGNNSNAESVVQMLGSAALSAHVRKRYPNPKYTFLSRSNNCRILGLYEKIALTISAGSEVSQSGGQDRTICWTPGTTQSSDTTAYTWKSGRYVYAVAFSPDGKKILSGSGDSTAVLRDVVTGETLHTWHHTSPVHRVAFSPDGRQVITGSNNGIIVLRDVATGKTIHTWVHGSHPTLTFSPDGKQVLIGSENNTAVLEDALTGKTLHKWRHGDAIRSVGFSPDGKKIVVAPRGYPAIVRDVSTGKTLQTLSEHEYYVIHAVFTPDGKKVLFESLSSVILQDILTGKIVHTWPDSNIAVNGKALSPDGKKILTVSEKDGTAKLRDVVSGNTIQVWKHNSPVWSAAFSPNGKFLLLGLDDGTVLRRDISSDRILDTWKHDDKVWGVAFSPDGRRALSCSGDSTTVLRNIGVRSDFQLALDIELRKIENEYRELPQIISARKLQLEKEKPVKDEFETVSNFHQRVAAWNSAVELLNSDIQTYYKSLGNLPLDMRAKAFERALSQAYGNPELQDIRYDPETARFFATLTASLDPEFKRAVSIPVPNDQARAAKVQLESDKNGLEIELRVTERNELIFGQTRVRIDEKIIDAQFLDKGFMPPAASTTASDLPLTPIALPIIPTLPQTANVKVVEDPSLKKLQMEVLQKEREQAELSARQAEEKRLRDRLAELDRKTRTEYNDDLPGLLSKLPAPKPNPRLYVLAIGINDYADVPDVPFADRSAQQFAEISQKLLGAQPQNVIVLTDGQATLGRLLSRLNTLLNRLGPQDQLLFYYAGHGVPSKDASHAYLLAQDGGPGSYQQPDLQLGQIYAVIVKSKVGQAKIFIDACFSGRSGKDSIVFEGIAPVVVSPRQNFPDSTRLAVMTAGRGDQFSNQHKGRGHRLFSYHLMKLILEEGPKLEIGQLHQRLRQRVLDESRRIGPEFEQEPDFLGNGRMVLLN
jgi:WD40 repeat protein